MSAGPIDPEQPTGHEHLDRRHRTIVRGTVITMDEDRRIVEDGAVVMSDATIDEVGPFDEVASANPDAVVTGSSRDLVAPGYVNGHQHLTGDRLIQSSIPDDLPPGESIFSWVVPVHAVHSADDDELSATLTLVESLCNGITTTFEAGTVAHPDRVAAAARTLGARTVVGTWGWDADAGPYTGTVDEVIERQRRCLDLLVDDGPVHGVGSAEGAGGTAGERLVSAWVSLVGHDLMSDELAVAAAELARERNVGLTFHLSPGPGDAESYLATTGKRPLVHLEGLGVLGPNVAVAHAVHIDDEELDLLLATETAVVSCPWAYLRLGQGITVRFRHLDLWRRRGRLALGCDAENAGDMVDGLRTAALFTGLAKDRDIDPTVFSAGDALELLTIGGARALGIGDAVGSIEVGKQADLVVHDRSGPEWIPPSPDPILQLVWGSDGRSVRDVWIAGRRVVVDRSTVAVDVGELAEHAAAAGRAVRRRAGIGGPD